MTQEHQRPRRPSQALATPSDWFAAAVYLALLTLAEIAVTFNPLLVFPLHGGLLALVAIHLTVVHDESPGRARPRAVRLLLLGFITAPLIRVISLGLPLGEVGPEIRYALAGIPMSLAAILAARIAGLTTADLGLRWRQSGWQLAVIAASVALGFIEFAILQPDPLGPLPWLPQGIVPALSLGLFTGLPEELIFRGLMQTAARPLLGRWNWVYVAGVFAVLHIGYNNVFDVLFVFVVGLIYGWVFERTRSIVGVSIGHGIANVVLFFIAPNVLSAR